jgi:hypothetical protein
MPIAPFHSQVHEVPTNPPSLSIFTCQVLPQPPRSICTSHARRALHLTSAHPYPKKHPHRPIYSNKSLFLSPSETRGVGIMVSHGLASQASSTLRSWFGRRFESPMSRSYVSQVCRIRALGSCRWFSFLGFFLVGKVVSIDLCMAICFSFMYA